MNAANGLGVNHSVDREGWMQREREYRSDPIIQELRNQLEKLQRLTSVRYNETEGKIEVVYPAGFCVVEITLKNALRDYIQMEYSDIIKVNL
jgi:hypothetical protein